MKGEKLVEPCLSLPPSLRSPSSLLTRASPPRSLHSRTTFAYPGPFPGGGDYKLTPFSILPLLQIDSFLRSPHLPGSLWPLKGYRKKIAGARPSGTLIPDVPSPTRSLSERSGERNAQKFWFRNKNRKLYSRWLKDAEGVFAQSLDLWSLS